ncbi:cobalamin-dependent protein [Candidatus Woesearchaeota archaeon]|nr:cobalamin-dependent protein [Candidatus Woesearchaeota archaeon]
MKALLVMPSLDNGYWKKLGKKVGPKSEPLSLLYIATFLNYKDHKAEILDCEAEGISYEELEQYIKNNNFDVVGVAMLTSMFSQSLEVCKVAKKVNKNIKTVVGGSHASVMPMETAQEESIDVVTIGEAEITFKELLDAFEKNLPLTNIKGIVYKENGIIKKNEPKQKVQDLDFFPIPDRKLIKMYLYRPSVSYYKRLPAYTMITTRGCPYRCTFCATANTGYRMHSTPRVIEEMKILVEEFGAKEILIRDDTFTLSRKRTIELCDAIIKEGLHKEVIWDCITRAGLVDLDLLKKMREAGCCGIHFGVEGGTQELIDTIHKDATLDQIRNAFKWARQVGLETRGYFMIGLPGAKKEDDLATINFAKELDPDWAQFTVTVPYPGTQLYKEAKEYGNLTSSSADWDNYQTWSGFSNDELPWTTHGRTSEELKAMQRHALKSFYFRPKVILRKVTNIDNFPILRKYVLGALALASGGSGRPPE